jgi:hypothetical protein
MEDEEGVGLLTEDLYDCNNEGWEILNLFL